MKINDILLENLFSMLQKKKQQQKKKKQTHQTVQQANGVLCEGAFVCLFYKVCFFEICLIPCVFFFFSLVFGLCSELLVLNWLFCFT